MATGRRECACGSIVLLAIVSALTVAASAAASESPGPLRSVIAPCTMCDLDPARPISPPLVPQGPNAPAVDTKATDHSPLPSGGTFRHGTCARKSRLLRAVSRIRFPRFEAVSLSQANEHSPHYPDLIPPFGDDPNDNETSGDPTEDDDDGWNDLSVDDGDTDLAAILWSRDWVSYLITPQPLPSVQTPAPLSLFLTLERFRC